MERTFNRPAGGRDFASKGRNLEIPVNVRVRFICVMVHKKKDDDSLGMLLGAWAPGESYHGAECWHHLYFSEEALDMAAMVVGPMTGIDTTQPPWTFNDDDLIGKGIVATTEEHEFNGRETVRIVPWTVGEWHPTAAEQKEIDQIIAKRVKRGDNADNEGEGATSTTVDDIKF